jgi:SWI/SNF-related matrix-associated actin-dependent regulator 1 of chromatin subfamily A
MKVRAHISGKYVLEHDQYSPALLEAGRVIPGCFRDGGRNAIAGSADAIEAAVKYLIEVRGLRADAFEDTEAVEWAAQMARRVPFAPDERLRDYQRRGVEFLRTVKRAILADDMGLGKTASAINAAISFAASKRTLIVCPSYVRGVWHNTHDGGEIAKWMHDYPPVYKCSGLKPREAPLDPEDIVICHYDILHAWAEKLAAWNPEVVIFDECHYLMNPETKRTKAAKQVSKNASYVWGLSGTPMTNRPRDLWGILDTIVPGRFGDNFFPFGLRYCGGYKEAVTPDKTVWKFDSKSNLAELRERLAHFMLRRTKTDVALELPAKTRQCIRVDVGHKNGAAAGGMMGSSGMRASLAVAADAKLKDSAVPLIQEHLQAGARVVVFTYRRAVAEYLSNECGGAVIHGGISQARREKTLHEIRTQEGSLLCATIDAASTGIDLSYADVAVFVELTYEPHELLQAEARLHRFGQKNPVLIQYLIARGTTDELVADVVIDKLDALENAIGGFSETALSSDLKEKEADIMADLYRRLGL